MPHQLDSPTTAQYQLSRDGHGARASVLDGGKFHVRTFTFGLLLAGTLVVTDQIFCS